jgi:alkylated DNA repair dioxygenase AlkB
MTFYKKGYHVVRNLISDEQTIKMYEHLNKRKDGNLTDEQAINTPSFYADELMQKMQLELLPKIEDNTGLELFKTYTYARVYKRGDILRIHRDRPACEISITLDLGGDKWPIWVLDRDENPVEVNLNPGDALIYRGQEIWHWRGKFDGDKHTQVFMHYVDKYGPCAWAKDDIKKQP